MYRKILVTGATGLVGSALVPRLAAAGQAVVRLGRQASRGKPGAAEGSSGPNVADFAWDPDRGQIDAAALDGVDAAVHLAGENIGTGRWTAAKKARILDSRVKGTRLLCERLAALAPRPRVLVSASATGYYGSRGTEVMTEESSAGSGFLADVCRQWEAAAAPAEKSGLRVVRIRFGVILSPAGGALAKMLPPFRLGMGGKVGNGKQYLSWIALEDAVSAICHALETESLSGPINAVTPYPVTNEEFTKALGRVLARPTMLPMPAFAARMAFGEMADETILSSTRAQPAKLLSTGFKFRLPELEGALTELIKNGGRIESPPRDSASDS